MKKLILCMLLSSIMVTTLVFVTAPQNAFAYTDDATAISEIKARSVSLGYDYWVFIRTVNGQNVAIFSKTAITAEKNSDGAIVCHGTDMGFINSSSDFSSSSFAHYGTTILFAGGSRDVPTMCGSSHNVLTTGDSSSVFFSVLTGFQGVVQKSVTNRAVLGQVLCLVPLVTSLVVGFLALRKALGLLSRLLHQA